MARAPAVAATRIGNDCGLSVEVNANGSLHRIDAGATSITLFPGNELEGGPANLYLRSRAEVIQCIPLLGPRSPTRFEPAARGNMLVGSGRWHDLHYTLALVLAKDTAAWFWHVQVENRGDARQCIDLLYTQDVALAPYGMVRTNEFYVSQYLDHTPLTHPTHGIAVASRQNLAVTGRHPWCVIGSLHRARSFATDALQVYGLDARAGREPFALRGDLAGTRLQHEHSLVALQDEAVTLPPHTQVALGFFGYFLADHAAATAPEDLRYVEEAVRLAPAHPLIENVTPRPVDSATLFSAAPLLEVLDLDARELDDLFGSERSQAEVDANGELLSFFTAGHHHVVMRAKELQVLRPHGHLLRTGSSLVPDEAALTSTVWMAGVFHSMLTQGHVTLNRCVSGVRSYLTLFRAQGLRMFLDVDGAWRLLDVPAAFAMTPDTCRWFYKHRGGLLEVFSGCGERHALTLGIKVHRGGAVRLLISHHIALDGDDGTVRAAVLVSQDDAILAVIPDATSELGKRFPRGQLRIDVQQGTVVERTGGDELLFADGASRMQPYVCMVASIQQQGGLVLDASLIETPAPGAAPQLLNSPFELLPPAGSALREQVEQLAQIIPWFMHDALIHYLAPRGLEQYSGGGWGTRDVSQGPVELLLALGRSAAVRDLLLRVMSAQNPDGDWPQWFMFFARERTIRADDSHGDIVFWPVLALAQYLLASADAGVLEEQVAFFDARGSEQGERASVWQHVQRALGVIERRRIAGTALAAYGHGDWNDSLQPADPSMRDHMCSAWTVTLHHQMLTTLADALHLLGRSDEAAQFQQQAQSVRQDFQRLLLVDDVLTGYALFESGAVRYLLHPRDADSGVHYSSLAMIHAILEGLFTPEQARGHLSLMRQHLTGPDGIRLFDRPLSYHGGPQRLFQRAESATFFGREIGLMYMHAHLRYAQALAHLGEAESFFDALCQVNPIGIRELVPQASLRQANCYYSSSDAAFTDRYHASAEYARIQEGSIALDGGWRVYSSGPGIAVGLIVRRLLGLMQEADVLSIDPVMPVALDGLKVTLRLWGRVVQLQYRVREPGCGVGSVQVDGREQALTYRSNPYRRGAALLSKVTLLRELESASSSTLLLISIGT